MARSVDIIQLASNSPPAGVGLCEDILITIFDQFDTSNISGRASCARCAHVCSLWSEPALRALWKSLGSAPLPLYRILLPGPKGTWVKRHHSVSLGTDVLGSFFQTLAFVDEQAELVEYFTKILQQAPFSNPDIWQRFLRYAAYIQHIDHWRCYDSEQPLLRALIARNGQKTFLPHLRSLTWLENPNGDGILALLASPSLTILEFQIHEKTSPRQVEEALYALSSTAPFLSCLRIHNYNKSNLLKPPVSCFQQLRSLVIYDDATYPDLTTLTPSCRQSLETLRYSPEGFIVAPDDTSDGLDIPNLRFLELFGPPTDRMRAFIARLRAPHVDSLDLRLRNQNRRPANSILAHTTLLQVVSEASFAPALCRLTVTVQAKSSLGSSPGIASTSVMSGIHPLFSLPALRVLSVVYFSPDATLGTDADMLAAATAWRGLESLSFDFPFSEAYEAGGFPCLPSLAHFATHCPRLAWLRIPLAFRTPPEPEVEDTGERLPISSHPLRTLEVQPRRWDSGVEPETIARRIDELFPNLGSDELRYRYPIRPRIPPRRYQGRWDLTIAAWKELRAARGGDGHEA